MKYSTTFCVPPVAGAGTVYIYIYIYRERERDNTNNSNNNHNHNSNNTILSYNTKGHPGQGEQDDLGGTAPGEAHPLGESVNIDTILIC